MLEFVADPSSVVRGEALAAAAALLDPNHPDGRAVEPLAAALRDTRATPQEHARMAALLGRTGAPRAAPLLADLMRTHDPILRIAAIDAMGTLGAALAPSVRTDQNGAADDALLDAIVSPDAVVRLHAATAQAEAGGSRARDALMARLDGGDEVDRAAILTALGGVLARAPSEAAIAKLADAFELAAGPERDAILEAIARAPLPAAMRVLDRAARSSEPADRLMAATMLAAHPADSIAVTALRALLADPDGPVRAQAAWSLGTTGDATDIGRLSNLQGLRPAGPAAARVPLSESLDMECNAAAAIGRISARVRDPGAAARALCPLLANPRPYIRADALAGLALAGARCGNGAAERAVLAEDPSEDARAAAALALWHSEAAADTQALQRCARGDPSGPVAARCRIRAATPSHVQAVLVYVIAEGASSPRPEAPYALLMADGTLRTGTTDRRGAAFDPAAPDGEIVLRKPSALAH